MYIYTYYILSYDMPYTIASRLAFRGGSRSSRFRAAADVCMLCTSAAALRLSGVWARPWLLAVPSARQRPALDAKGAGIRGSHLSNTTCLMQVFLESCA